MRILFLRVAKDGQLVGIRQFPVSPILIGSNVEAQLRLDSEGVGPAHAMIELRGADYFVTDLGTETGTFLNGKRLVEEKLSNGDVISFADFSLEVAVGMPTFRAETVVQATVPVAPPKAKPPEPRPVQPTRRPPPPVEESVNSLGGEFHTPEVPKAIPLPPVLGGKKKKRKTFAPGDQVEDLKTHLKPGRGTVVEFVLAWGNRIIDVYHAEQPGPVTVGSHPDNDIVLPILGGPHLSHTIAQIGTELQIFFTDSMDGEYYQNGRASSIRSLIAARQFGVVGTQYWVSLKQGEMLRLDFGGGVSIYVRFSEETIQPLPGPLFDLSPSELMSLLFAFIIIGVIALYTTVMEPPPEKEVQPEPERKAVFVYKRQEAPPPVDLPTPPPTPAPTPTKREQVKVDVTKTTKPVPRESTKKTAPAETKKSAAKEGAASDAPKFKSTSQEKKLTTANAGDDKGIKRGGSTSKTPNASGGSQGPTDVRKVGILSAFGKSGMQQQLAKTNAGSGNVAELGQTAGGKAGVAAGAGTEQGRGTKDLGASGKGTSTFGISGVQTQGYGGGLKGYGTGSLGNGKGASIVPGGEGEAYEGTIDREAIRRVIMANLKQLRACYERALKSDPGLYGRVVIEFSIVDQGRVNISRTKTSTLNSKLAEDCMVARLRTWTFPEPPAGQEPLVQFPFVFSSQ